MAIASLIVLVPVLVAGVLAATAPVERRVTGPLAAIGAAIAAVVLGAILLGDAGGDRLVLWMGGWHPRHGVAFGIDFAVDGIGAGLALLVAVLAIPTFVLSARLVIAAPQLFHAVALLFVAAMIAFCLTGDLFDLFVFFELMSVAAYVLVGFEVGRRVALEGALTFALTNTTGSILLLFGIGLVYGETGVLNLAQLGHALGAHGVSGPVVVGFALIACGLLVKAAVVPFHLWTADAYAVAPTPVLILLGGAFSELGIYGLARVYWTAFEPALGPHEATLRVLFVVLGLATGLVGGGMALAQHHLKRMLAFVTIAQVGLFLVGFGLLSADGLAGAAVFVVGDAFVKAALFATAAVLHHRYDAIEEDALHGRARELWPLGVLVLVASLAVAGLPPFGSFVGRGLVEDAALKEPGYHWVPAVIALVSALCGGALLRVTARVFAGWGAVAPRELRGEPPEDDSSETDEPAEGRVSPFLWGPAVALVAAGLAWGLVPGLLDAVAHAAARFTDTAGYAAAVLGGRAPAPPVPHLRWPGPTGFLYATASVAGALAVAAAGLREQALPRRVAAAVGRVRDLHSGHPGDYVAWTASGAAAIGAVLALALH